MRSCSHRFCVAPMMEWTDRHCRYFHRQISRHARLYTEMLTPPALIHGDRERLLSFHPAEQPVALQLGGSDPAALAEAAVIGALAGYAEINLNIGCPSPRVQRGRFGACLMREPTLVASCLEAMAGQVKIPITVKCRIGVDNHDSENQLRTFVETLADAGCKTFIVHARKAWLQGLSPKQNREVPPLEHDRVYRLKERYPELNIIINGGIETLDMAEEHLNHVDGVMVGRAAYQNPYMLSDVDRRFFNADAVPPNRTEVMRALIPYTERHLNSGGRLNNIARHILGLYHAQPRARTFRRYLSEAARAEDASAEVLTHATALAEGHAIEPQRLAAE